MTAAQERTSCRLGYGRPMGRRAYAPGALLPPMSLVPQVNGDRGSTPSELNGGCRMGDSARYRSHVRWSSSPRRGGAAVGAAVPTYYLAW
jgi:hypothetical protein